MMDLILALSPIVIFIALLSILRLSGAVSSLLGLLATAVIAVGWFGFPADSLLPGIAYGAMKALFPILFIVVMAMFSYNLLQASGQMEIIKNQFASFASEKSTQVLLITWGFGGILESMAGFGTVEAIGVSLLISLGFRPLFAAVASLLGNSVITAFGAVGTPILVLAKETGIPAGVLGTNIVWQLAAFTYLFPLLLLVITTPRRKALPGHLLLAFLVGSVSLGGQLFAVKHIGVEAPSIVGSLCSIGVILLYSHFRRHRRTNCTAPSPAPSVLLRAWSVYGLILLLILLTSPLCPPLHDFVERHAVSRLIFSIGGEEVTHTVGWLAQSGLLIGLGTWAGGWIQGMSPGRMGRLLSATLVQLRKVFVTLICLISLSTLMNYAGMITCISTALAATTRGLYPFFSPLIGCLGTFITGSGTSANILFGKLQADVAAQLHIDPDWLAAGNMSGTTAGKIFSPQSIAIVTSNPALHGQEDRVLRATVPYALVYVCLIGLVVLAG